MSNFGLAMTILFRPKEDTMRQVGTSVSFWLAVVFFLSAVAASSIASNTNTALATDPGCLSIRTDQPHKSSGDPVVRAHGTTDCRGVSGVTFVDVSTEMFRNGSFAASGWAEGTTYAYSTADKVCSTSGNFFARSNHYVIKSGIWYTPYSESATVYVSC